MRTITVTNQKGGTGKSTTAAAIGAGLLRNGYRVLFVDMDAQGDLSDTLEADTSGLTTKGVMEVLEESATAQEAIQHTPHGDLIASSPTLTGADMVIIATGKEYRLREALEAVSGAYDYCIIDTPPALGIATINALTASDSVIIPAKADYYSVKGIGKLYSSIRTVRKYCNPALKVEGILLTAYSSRTIISRDMADMLESTAAMMETKVFSTKIRECSALREAQAVHQDIYSYAPKSNASADYTALVNEIEEGLSNG